MTSNFLVYPHKQVFVNNTWMVVPANYCIFVYPTADICGVSKYMNQRGKASWFETAWELGHINLENILQKVFCYWIWE